MAYLGLTSANTPKPIADGDYQILHYWVSDNGLSYTAEELLNFLKANFSEEDSAQVGGINMIHRLTPFGIATVPLVLLAALSPNYNEGAPQPPPITPEEDPEPEPIIPSEALWGSGIQLTDDLDCRPIQFDTGYTGINATADYDTMGQSVNVRWLRTAVKVSSIQKIDVLFYPTSIAGSNDGRLLVAGSHPRTGRAIVEEWTFEQGLVIPIASMSSTGTIVWPDILIPVVREVVYEAPEGSDELVESIFWNLGAVDKAFIQFSSTRTLVELDLQLKTLSTLYDTDQSTPTPTLSELDMTFGDKATFVHSVFGNVYLLCGRGNNTSSLALIDHDKDGELDLEHFIALPPLASAIQIDAAMYATGLLDPDLIEGSY